VALWQVEADEMRLLVRGLLWLAVTLTVIVATVFGTSAFLVIVFGPVKPGPIFAGALFGAALGLGGWTATKLVDRVLPPR
jgi:hypothetical protein